MCACSEKGVSANCIQTLNLTHTLDTPTYTVACAMQIHEVAARRFCLVSADHPLVSAVRYSVLDLNSPFPLALVPYSPPHYLSLDQISENAEKLQMGEISMMFVACAPLNLFSLLSRSRCDFEIPCLQAGGSGASTRSLLNRCSSPDLAPD